MKTIESKYFESIVSDAIDAIPPNYLKRLENVAFIIEDEPSLEQRHKLKLRFNESLFGLYEGAPLPTRFGQTKLLPDKITIFKQPLIMFSHDIEDLKKKVHNTVWHEVAHYFGLDHGRIDEIERKS
ncbi:metallopeptidase family protein [Candidatus Saccharibacteria bacterium]|nr:metallopeptidase family protein [Candidatus Saccharibacteria bacterium]